MTKWEYRIVKVYEEIKISGLNAFGADGWELVSIVLRPDCVALFFKRPKEETK